MELSQLIEKLTDEELDEGIKAIMSDIDEVKTNLINRYSELNLYRNEKQKRWAKTLTPEEISNL